MRLSPLARAAAVLALTLTTLVSSVSAQQQLSDLDRVGTELLRFQKPGALYGYLRDYHPELFKVADKAGLAEALDGKVPMATFKTALDKAVKAAGSSVTQDAATLETIMTAHPIASTAIVGLSAEQVQGKGAQDLVPALKTGLFDASQNWISKTWSADKRGSVGVRSVPGKLLWFNPNVSIPELGIKAGVPLTDAQKEAVASLFSFETVPGAADQATGTAAFPAHVGRAVNPNSNVITVLNSQGEVISDLTIKGAGPNAANTGRDGRLDRSEALLDSNVAQNLFNAGVKNYDSLCVIEPEGVPGKAILVRAPRTMLRQIDISLDPQREAKGLKSLTDDELRATLEHVTNEAAIREGKPSLSIADWIKETMPRMTGENVGRLIELGVEHGSLTYGSSLVFRDNHGLGETVDWGAVRLRPAGNTSQVELFWNEVKKSVDRVNQILPDAEKAVVEDVRSVFDAAVEAGRAAAKGLALKIDPALLPELSDGDLRTLARQTVDPSNPTAGELNQYSATRDESIARLTAAGHVLEPAPSFDALAKEPLVVLQEIARGRGIQSPADSRAEVIASITHQPVAEVTQSIAHFDAAQAAAPRPEDGFTRRLGDLASDHDAAKVDPARAR